MLFAGTPLTVNPYDSNQRETVAISSGATPNRCPYSAAVIHLWKFGEALSVSDSTNCLAARSCSRRTLQLKVHIQMQIVRDGPQIVLSIRFETRVAHQGNQPALVNRLGDEGARPAVCAWPPAVNANIRPASASTCEKDLCGMLVPSSFRFMRGDGCVSWASHANIAVGGYPAIAAVRGVPVNAAATRRGVNYFRNTESRNSLTHLSVSGVMKRRSPCPTPGSRCKSAVAPAARRASYRRWLWLCGTWQSAVPCKIRNGGLSLAT